MATSLGEGKLCVQTSWTLLKNWPYVTSCSCGGYGWIYMSYEVLWVNIYYIEVLGEYILHMKLSKLGIL